MIHRYRQLSAVVLAAACIFAVTACGSSSSSTSIPAAAGAKFPAGARRGGKAGAPPAGRGGFVHDSAQSAALKACGVSFGSGPRGGPAGAGTPTAG
jgi:hypothetical protein